MTTPQGMLELADELDGIVSALKMGGKGNEVWMANSDAPTIQRAAAALRLSASPAGNGGRAVEVDIGAAMAALQASPELCEMMNEMVGGPALVEAQAEIERLNAIIALTPAVAPDGAREALAEALRGLEYIAPAIPVLRTMFMTANLKLGAAKVEEMDASNKEAIEKLKSVLAALALPAVVGIEGREAIIRECELAARGPVYKEIYNGWDGHNWHRDTHYGRGRHAAADAVAALARHPHQPVEDKR